MSPTIAAWAVHLYTALGAVLALLAWSATTAGAYGAAFAWMAVALVIDCTDGTLARRFQVKIVLPQFDGARLDDIVDYLNYVFIPLLLAIHADLLPAGTAGLAVAACPLLASGYGFCQIDAKTEDHFFKGFPSYWNVVVFYFYVLQTPAWFNALTLAVLAVLVFVPLKYFYPSRTPTARRTTHVLAAIWAVTCLLLLSGFPSPPLWLAWLSLFFPIYYLAMSVHLHVQSQRR